jgi:hypothetical protein
MNGYNFSVIKYENEINKIYSNGLFLSFCFLAFFFLPYIRASFSGCYIRRLVGGRAAAAAAATAIE